MARTKPKQRCSSSDQKRITNRVKREAQKERNKKGVQITEQARDKFRLAWLESNLNRGTLTVKESQPELNCVKRKAQYIA